MTETVAILVAAVRRQASPGINGVISSSVIVILTAEGFQERFASGEVHDLVMTPLIG